MRSPDPINWTVPLDTGKTFSVTQSIKDGGMIKDGYLCLGMILFRFYIFLETITYRVDYYIIITNMLNTQYMTNSTLLAPVKMEYG